VVVAVTPATTLPVADLAGWLAAGWLASFAVAACVLVVNLLACVLRHARDRRHPQRAAARRRAEQRRRLAAGWPLLAQTLGLGYTDVWTRQHRFPAAEFALDGQGVTATVAAVPGAGLADYQRAAASLADAWGCVAVRAEQPVPGLVQLRGLFRDPLLAPARTELPGRAPASLALGGWGGPRTVFRSWSAWPRSPGSWSRGWRGSAKRCWWPTWWASSPRLRPCSSSWSTARAARTTTT
jgi:hypothetical protein